MATKKLAAKKLVRVVYWAGTTQCEAEVSNYAEAMRVIDERHRNAYSPSFYEISTGKELHDDGNGLRAVGSDYYAV